MVTSHTLRGQSPASWQLTLAEDSVITEVILHNRDGNAGSRLRDITATIFDSSGSAVYQSGLLNPENTLNSPDQITITLPEAVTGRTIEIVRTPDPDLSGSNGAGNADEPDVLSLGEVLVQGCALSDFIPTPEPEPEPTPEPNPGPPAVPTLLSPGATSATNTPIYSWNSVAGATRYNLLVPDSTGFVINTFFTAEQVGCDNGGVCSITPSTALASGNVTWYVRSATATIASAYSTPLNFTAN